MTDENALFDYRWSLALETLDDAKKASGTPKLSLIKYGVF
jgi:hypothetical protein